MQYEPALGKKAFQPLTPQEEVFVAEYLVHFNAAKAARQAGMTKKDANANAFKWVKLDGPKPHVARAIRNAIRARLNRLEVTADRVIAELAKLGFSNMLNYIRLDDEGLPKFDLMDLDESTAAAIKMITIDEFKEGKGQEAREIRRIKLELHDKRGPLVELGKHLGILGATAIGPKGDADDIPTGDNKGGNTYVQQFNISLIPSGAKVEDGKIIPGEIVHRTLPLTIEDYSNADD